MNQRRHGWPLLAVVALLGAATTGCQSNYRGDTVLHPDGRVERTIEQPEDETPPAARQPTLWKELTVKEERKEGGFRQNRRTLTARGEFAAPGGIPDYVVFEAPKQSGLPNSHLKRDYQREDYVFVTEHRWNETLTEVVTFNDMRVARDELADLAINAFADAFQQGVGPDYDATDMIRWMRTEGKQWLGQLTDELYLRAAAREPVTQEALAGDLADICARHGLQLKAHGKLLEKDDLERVVRDYVIGLLTKHVRNKKDLKPVDKETAAAWLADKGPIAQGFEKLDEKKYGGKEALQQRGAMLLTRILGIHFLANAHFDYTLEAPGMIVETNGQILSPNRVRWEFKGADAYPAGYGMRCRVLAPETAVQQELLKGQPLTTPEAMLRLVALVSDQKPLVEALRQCRREHSMKPFSDYRRSLDGDTAQTDAKTATDKLMTFLNLPQHEP